MLTVGEVAPGQLDALGLLDGAPFQSSAGWWRAVAATAIPDGCHALFPVVRQGGAPVLMMPLLRARGGLSALVTPYTCLYQPAVAPAADLERAAAALARHLGPVLRIDAIDPAWTGWPQVIRGVRHGGYRAMPFASFVNWYEPLGGRDWAGYLADRPGALRETIRRRLRRAERDARLSVGVAGPGEEAAYLAEYEQVHAQSWKAPEPYPGFAAAFVAEAARAGVLRIAVLRRDGQPVAAQYWTVQAGVATVLKLAHVASAKGDSPGTVLTAWLIRRLVDVEKVQMLDFGRGDDAYKSQWATGRRQRSGLIIADPGRLRGAAAVCRQVAGVALRRWRRPDAM